MTDYSSMTDSELLAEYERVKAGKAKYKNKQLGLKYQMNGEYGALGNIWFRYFDLRLATAVTLSGRLAIRWIEKYLMEHPLQEKYRWTIIYSDTDSIYMGLEYVRNKLAERNSDEHYLVNGLIAFSEKIVQPLIEEGYQKLADYVGANENRMFMKREKTASRGLFVGKKKYALLVWDSEDVRYDEPKLKVKGIETVRSSTPKIVQKSLEKVLKLIMTDPKSIPKLIADTKESFMAASPEEVAISTSVNKMSAYETSLSMPDGSTVLHYKPKCPIGVRAAILHNRYVIKNDIYTRYPEIRQGEKIKYVYMRLPNPLHENVFRFSRELPDPDRMGTFVDYKTQFEKTFMSPIENITGKIGMSVSAQDGVNINDFF